jgi:hypothetical protein
MKTKLHTIIATVFLFSIPILTFCQTPDLRTSADFILFSSSGGITNTGVSQILGGAIGTDFGALTGFEDVNCVKHIADAATEQCKLDLQTVYNEIATITPTATITAASLNGGTITPGIYQINSAVALTVNLTLDAQGDPDALFIFKLTGAFTTAASVNILLINGASVTNVFWHGNAAIGAGAGASLKGTFLTNAGAVALGAGVLLEGRALTILGEVTISGSNLIGCFMPEATTVTLTQPSCSVATGTIEITAPLGAGMTYSINGIDFTNTTGLFNMVPGGDYTVISKNPDDCLSMTNISIIGFGHAPELGTITDFVLFTSAGAVGNTGVSFITGGAIGTDFGAITGFETVDCAKYIQDAKTAQCKLDLQAAFIEIAAIPTTETITAASLASATITAGVYHINSATALTTDLILDAENNTDALFIFKVTGAFSMAAAVDILLINGATVNNVFWNVDGAVSSGAGASMKGTFLALAGEIALGNGATLEGRALSIAGAANLLNSNISVCIKPALPSVNLIQPNCSFVTGSINIISPIAEGMTYRIDYCDYSNTTGIFTDVLAGTYIVTAKDSEGCLSEGTTVVINEESPPITWTGAASNEWNNPENWDIDEIPGIYCNAVIPVDAVVNQTSDTPAVCKNLSIGAGAVLTIEAGKTLTINETLTNNAGITGLIIKSDASGTGSLKHNSANVSATFERYLNNADWSDWRDGWHFLSSPVAAQAISPNFIVDPPSDYDFYTWHEPSNLWGNFKNTTEPPIWSTANTINNGLSNNSANFLAGKGYMVAYNSPDVKSYSGFLNVADITIQDLTITGTNNSNRSRHLLGNPFSCALAWDASADWKFTNIAGVAKIWNEALQSYLDLTSTPATFIPATNGFMIQVNSGTGSLTVPASKRDHSMQAFYKNTESISRILLVAAPLDRSNGQQSTIFVLPEATENVDLMYDSEFLPAYAPQFYSISGDFKLSTNSLPSINEEIVIPFGFVKNVASDFSIELVEIIEGQMLYLSDLKTSTVHDFDNDPVYIFHAEEGDNPNRFLLHFGAVDINEKPDKETLRAYVYGSYLYLMFPKGKAQIEVFNILGNLLQSSSFCGEGFYSQAINLPSGVYIVRLQGEHIVKSVKVIVE